jgi:hypothetical protein
MIFWVMTIIWSFALGWVVADRKMNRYVKIPVILVLAIITIASAYTYITGV